MNLGRKIAGRFVFGRCRYQLPAISVNSHRLAVQNRFYSRPIAIDAATLLEGVRKNLTLGTPTVQRLQGSTFSGATAMTATSQTTPALGTSGAHGDGNMIHVDG
jgi:hypothetical protein